MVLFASVNSTLRVLSEFSEACESVRFRECGDPDSSELRRSEEGDREGEGLRRS